MYTIPKKLLSPGATNAKTAKNEIKTFILYLAPYNQNSKKINICPKASKGCAAACLFTAGRGAFSNVIKSRTNKTEYFLHNKSLFIKQLAKEILSEVAKARKKGEKVAFRLNGTSDLDFVYLLKKYAALDIADLYPVAVFYDYTKILGKVKKYLDYRNYFVTFSRAEDNEAEALEALALGANVSAVFSPALPDTWQNHKVIDGDKSDLIMIYNRGVVLGLKAKGRAKTDKTNFTINIKQNDNNKQQKNKYSVIKSL